MRSVLTLSAVLLFLLVGCQTMPPIRTVEQLSLERFMGRWYVIATIPTFIEKDAYNSVETYRLQADGTVQTVFTFNKGGFDGPVKTYRPKGFVREDAGNAVWDMQFVWPFRAEYRVVYLNDDYSHTVIGRTKRDYVWIMARTPSMPAADFDRIVRLIADEGYDVSKLVKVPHR